MPLFDRRTAHTLLLGPAIDAGTDDTLRLLATGEKVLCCCRLLYDASIEDEEVLAVDDCCTYGFVAVGFKLLSFY